MLRLYRARLHNASDRNRARPRPGGAGNSGRGRAADRRSGRFGDMESDVSVHSGQTAPAGAQRAAPSPPADVAVTALYQAHALGLIRLAHIILGDAAAAEDVVQEAFTGLYRRWAQLSDPAKALPYVRSSRLNACRSQLRQLGRWPPGAEQAVPPSAPRRPPRCPGRTAVRCCARCGGYPSGSAKGRSLAANRLALSLNWDGGADSRRFSHGRAVNNIDTFGALLYPGRQQDRLCHRHRDRTATEPRSSRSPSSPHGPGRWSRCSAAGCSPMRGQRRSRTCCGPAPTAARCSWVG